MRAALRSGGEMRELARRRRRERWPALVALLDISGSMAAYSRMMLHFLHAAANAPAPPPIITKSKFFMVHENELAT